jgi:serine/threonine protein kinase
VRWVPQAHILRHLSIMSESDLLIRAKGRIGGVLCGKYRLDSVLGVGGMAVVFAATHRNQKRVAIKVLHPELSIHEELRTRFLREGYAANTVDHPGAVAVLDDDTAEDGVAFLVMERLEGDEVDRLWEARGRRIDAEIVLAMASQLLDVLSAAHAKSIVHRDIKPSNLYVTREGTLKVLDFGIARVRDAASAGGSATSTGMMLGTPAYMAPEQALGKSKEIDGTTDIWSVGATMFSLLSGHFVHEGESVTQLVVMAATTPARSLATVAPDVDPRVVALVDKAIAFERAARWPSALAMRDAVRATYASIYGTKLGKEPLLRLLGVEAEVESTMHAPSAMPPTPVPELAPQAFTKAVQTLDEPVVAAVPRTREMTARPSWPVPLEAPGNVPGVVPPTQNMGAVPGTPARMFNAPPVRPSQSPPRASPSYAPPPGYAPGGLMVQQSPLRAAMGATTAHPVSSEPYAAGIPKKNPLVLPAAVVGAGLVVGLGLWLGLSGSRATPAAATSATTQQVATSPPVVTAPQIPFDPASPPLPASASVFRPAVSPPQVVSPIVPPVPAVPAVPGTPRGVTVTPFLPPPPTRAPASKPNCDIPYTIKNGIRVPKPECLN